MGPRHGRTLSSRIGTALLAVAGICAGPPPMAAPVLVSTPATGAPGSAASGVYRDNDGAFVPTAAAVTDPGVVFFLSAAPLADADSDAAVDVYRWDGTATQVAVPTPPGQPTDVAGLAVSNDGAVLYVLRETVGGTFREIYVVNDAGPQLRGILADIGAPAVAAAGSVGVMTGDIAGVTHILRQTLADGATEQLTAGANGDSAHPSVSADGTRVVFASAAFNLVADDTNALSDIFLYDAGTGATTLVARRLTGENAGTADAETPWLSATGTTVCFVSEDAGFVGHDTNAVADIFVVEDGMIARIPEVQPDGASDSPRLSADGRFVVFRSRATNLAAGASGAFYQIYVYDRENRSTTRLSDRDGTAADADCFVPGISPLGRYVTFVSAADNLAPDGSGGQLQVYRVDRGAAFADHRPAVADALLSVAVGTTEVEIRPVAADADGDELSYRLEAALAVGALTDRLGTAITPGTNQPASGLPWRLTGPGDTDTDVLVTAADATFRSPVGRLRVRFIDPVQGRIERLSELPDGTQGGSDSYRLQSPGLAVTARGWTAVFASSATAFGTRSASGLISDIFRRTDPAGTLSLLSDGWNAAKNCSQCALAGDGSAVLYDTQDGKRVVWQATADGRRCTIATLSADLSAPPGLSHDGQRGIYCDGDDVYIFEATARPAPQRLGAGRHPALSADGRVAAYELAGTTPPTVQLYDVAAGEAYAQLADAAQPRLSATGRYVAALNAAGMLRVHDLATGTATTIAAAAANPDLSADGRYAYYTAVDANFISQAYRCDIFAAARAAPVLLSRTASGDGGNGACYRGRLSATGQFCLFASDAEDLVGADSNGRRDIFRVDFSVAATRPPSAADRATQTVEDEAVDIPLQLPDGDSRDLSFAVATPPAHGGLGVIDARLTSAHPRPTVRYTPTPGFVGEDRFTVTVTDGVSISAPAAVTVTVTAGDHPPQLHLDDRLILAAGSGEGLVPAAWFSLTDPDPGDPDPAPADIVFRLTSSPAAGVLRTGAGQPLVAGDTFGVAAFDLVYTPADDRTFAEEHLRVVAEGAGWTTAPAELYVVIAPRRVDVPLGPGWNLASFPHTPVDAPERVLASAARSNTVVSPPWEWDADRHRLIRAKTLRAGRGYWIYATAAASLTGIPARPASSERVAVSPGWNLLGPVGDGAAGPPPSADAGVDAVIWRWLPVPGRFAVAAQWRAGNGYWIHLLPGHPDLDAGLR